MSTPSDLQSLNNAKRISLTGKVQKSDVYLALLILILCSFLSNRFESLGLASFFITLVNTNLFVLLAFYVLLQLITLEPDTRPARLKDYIFFVCAALSLFVFGQTGSIYDIGFVTGGLALWFWTRRKAIRQDQFIALVCFALTLNILISPVLFQFFKSIILIGEVDLIAFIWSSIGFNVWADGQYLGTPGGMRIQLIGACSVFTNLSFGFLCYASMKAFNKSPMSFGDIKYVIILIVLLAVGNAIRIGLMLPGYEAYVFWHTGDGATIFGIVQFIIIVLISCISVLVRKKV